MIKFEIDKEHRIQHLECAGGPVELAAEIAMLAGAIYAQTSGLNPQVAERFKGGRPDQYEERFSHLGSARRMEKGGAGLLGDHHDLPAA